MAPFLRREGESPYKLHGELQDIMTQHAPIVRDAKGLEEGLEKVIELGQRAQECGTGGPTGRAFNPGWHAARDLTNMIINAEAVFRSAIERKESRGAHARSDFPKLDPKLGTLNFVVEKTVDGMNVRAVENEPIPYELLEVISQSHEKYTPEET
jgi:succinate dehydrogenase / fumarate reductase flavoprotein subunit